MANLQASGAISINDLKTAYGGPASPALSNYYRGGSYTKTIAREPTSGEYYDANSNWTSFDNGTLIINWGGGTIVNGTVAGSMNLTSYTSGAYTYYRGSLRASNNNGYSLEERWGVYRTSSVNGGIPSSGAISLSSFYGAYY